MTTQSVQEATTSLVSSNPIYEQKSKEQFDLINQIRKLTAQANINHEALRKLCPHSDPMIYTGWTHEDEKYLICMVCANHNPAYWMNSLYKNCLYNTTTQSPIEQPPPA